MCPCFTFRQAGLAAGVYFQLSFSFVRQNLFVAVHHVKDRRRHCGRVVENNGFEPLTPCLQSRCSSQLS